MRIIGRWIHYIKLKFSIQSHFIGAIKDNFILRTKTLVGTESIKNIMSYKNFIENKKNYLNNIFPEISFNSQGKISSYTNCNDEYFILQNGVGFRDISYKSIMKLEGKDVLDFIHRISTNSIKNLQAGEKNNTLFLNDKGKIIDRTSFLSFGEYYFLIGSENHKEKLNRWIQRFIINEDIKISDLNSDFSIFEILGPQSESYLTMICGNEIDKLTENNFIAFNYDAVDFYLIKNVEANQIAKYWIISDSNNYESIINIFLKEKSVFDFGLVGIDAYEIFRVENQIAKAPNELSDEFNPHDLKLIHEVDFSKGCYIGQEIIARQDTYNKIQYTLSNILIDANGFELPIELIENNQLLCKISSVVNSPKHEKILGLALIRNSFLNGEKSFSFNYKDRKIVCSIL